MVMVFIKTTRLCIAAFLQSSIFEQFFLLISGTTQFSVILEGGANSLRKLVT